MLLLPLVLHVLRKCVVKKLQQLFGLVMVVTSRGCGTIAGRANSRALARYQLLQNDFAGLDHSSNPDEKMVRFMGDGLSLTPLEYTTLITQLAESEGFESDVSLFLVIRLN